MIILIALFAKEVFIKFSTLVTAVYLLIRYFNAFLLSDLRLYYYIMYISVLTTFIAGLFANLELGLKKLLHYL